MIKNYILLLFVLGCLTLKAQNKTQAYQGSEWLKYRIHYGLLNAGYAELELEDSSKSSKEFHVVGKGKTTGMVSVFFKVKDQYESYFSKESQHPRYAIRRVDEGGYIINRDLYFEQGMAITQDFKKNTIDTVAAVDVYDLLSAFYKLRNQDFSKVSDGEEIDLKLFFDREVFSFKLKVLGREVMRTKFGKVKAIKLRPLVQSGRVFKEQESLTLWISDDQNKIPLRIKAELAVGSLKADLDAYKGLNNAFNIIVNN